MSNVAAGTTRLPDRTRMGMLMASVGALSTFYPDAGNIRDADNRHMQIVRMIAKMPTLGAWSFRHAQGKPFVYPDNELGYTANFLSMLFRMSEQKFEADERLVKALDVLFILHADHEQNCSTNAVRSVGSSQVDPYSAVGAGIAALYGPLHGGANEAVLRMLRRIGSKDNIPDFIEGVKDGNERLMGFGHRVYKNYDPRATIIKKACDDVFEVTGVNPLLEIAQELEKIALEDEYFVSRKLYPNVDFYSGLIYEAFQFPPEMFTVLFAIGRTPGWLAQWLELVQDKEQKIARPKQIYTGDRGLDFTPASERWSLSGGLQVRRSTPEDVGPIRALTAAAFASARHRRPGGRLRRPGRGCAGGLAAGGPGRHPSAVAGGGAGRRAGRPRHLQPWRRRRRAGGRAGPGERPSRPATGRHRLRADARRARRRPGARRAGRGAARRSGVLHDASGSAPPRPWASPRRSRSGATCSRRWPSAPDRSREARSATRSRSTDCDPCAPATPARPGPTSTAAAPGDPCPRPPAGGRRGSPRPAPRRGVAGTAGRGAVHDQGRYGEVVDVDRLVVPPLPGRSRSSGCRRRRRRCCGRPPGPPARGCAASSSGIVPAYARWSSNAHATTASRSDQSGSGGGCSKRAAISGTGPGSEDQSTPPAGAVAIRVRVATRSDRRSATPCPTPPPEESPTR